MGYYLKFIDAAKQYRFNLHAGNGEKILHSEGYVSEAGCDNGIASCQVNSQIDDRYEDRTSTDGQYYFVLKAGNGEIIGRSELYTTQYGRDSGKASVKANGKTTDIRKNY